MEHEKLLKMASDDIIDLLETYELGHDKSARELAIRAYCLGAEKVLKIMKEELINGLKNQTTR